MLGKISGSSTQYQLLSPKAHTAGGEDSHEVGDTNVERESEVLKASEPGMVLNHLSLIYGR